jgi:hypothetical protein
VGGEGRRAFGEDHAGTVTGVLEKADQHSGVDLGGGRAGARRNNVGRGGRGVHRGELTRRGRGCEVACEVACEADQPSRRVGRGRGGKRGDHGNVDRGEEASEERSHGCRGHILSRVRRCVEFGLWRSHRRPQRLRLATANAAG